MNQRGARHQGQDDLLVRRASLGQRRGVGDDGDLAEDVDDTDVAGLEQLRGVGQVLADQLVVGGALHDLGYQVLRGIAELGVSVVQGSLSDTGGGRYVVGGASLGGDRGSQRGDCGVQLVFQQDLGEGARSNFDALHGWALQPGHLGWLVADRTEAAGNLHRGVFQLGQVGDSCCAVGSVAIYAALGSGQGLEERLLQEVASEAVRRQDDRAIAGSVERRGHLVQGLQRSRHDVFVEHLHLRQGHKVNPLLEREVWVLACDRLGALVFVAADVAFCGPAAIPST
ncbi:hypothetical protein D3C84_703600 [compost metagenome]